MYSAMGRCLCVRGLAFKIPATRKAAKKMDATTFAVMSRKVIKHVARTPVGEEEIRFERWLACAYNDTHASQFTLQFSQSITRFVVGFFSQTHQYMLDQATG